MSQEVITFFMPVTDSDVIIADYTIASYERLRKSRILFKVVVYPNYLSPALKERHFPRWRRHSYVEIVDTQHQDKLDRPSPWEEEDRDTAQRYHSGALKSGRKAYKWEGPWERHDFILDRELKRITTSYVASVDADFEILDGKVVAHILERMERNPNLKVMSSDYSPTRRYETNVFSTGYCYLWERYHTWFCVYKREALEFPELHRYREKVDKEGDCFYAWDTSAFFQQRLREELGYEMESVQGLDNSFIHYSAFSKNRTIGYGNVWLYRRLKISAKVPLLRQFLPYDEQKFKFVSKVDRRLSYMVREHLLRRLFDETERCQPLYAGERGA